MLRSDVPPPAPAVMPSMSSPASLNIPFSSATAHGSVATRRPYWLTVILAAKAGIALSAVANIKTADAIAMQTRMSLPPFFMCVGRTGRCACELCTLGFRSLARSRQDHAKDHAKDRNRAPEQKRPQE